jgi:catalase
MMGYESSYVPTQYASAAAEVNEKWEAGKVRSAVFGEVEEGDYVQARGLWEVLGREEGHQERFVGNVAGHLSGAKKEVREGTYGMLGRVDAELGRRIREATEEAVKGW